MRDDLGRVNMKKKRRKRRNGNFRGMCCISAVVLVLLAVFAVKNHDLKQANAAYSAELAQIQQDIENEKTRTEEIEEMKEYMQSDEYAEQVAKDKLGLAYEDEIVFKPE